MEKDMFAEAITWPFVAMFSAFDWVAKRMEEDERESARLMRKVERINRRHKR